MVDASYGQLFSSDSPALASNITMYSDCRLFPGTTGSFIVWNVLSYQHTYHAGNHADVLKHVILIDVLTGMQKKDTPVFVLDAFASRGQYDLNSEQALKNREFETGIGRLWELTEHAMPTGIKRWFDLIATQNPGKEISCYPGSTALIRACLREQDRMAACEMHPEEFNQLRANFSGSRHSNKQIALHKRDAYEALKALLPPKEGRGLVFLDPSYEVKDEYRRIAWAVSEACQRFRAGIYMIWYPLLPAAGHLELFRQMKESGLRKILRVEMNMGERFDQMQMHGSGLLIINPPWQALETIRESAAWISSTLAGDKGKSVFDWLVPE